MGCGLRDVNLATIDLNLLTALEALLDERSVTRAAGRVGVSQPAMSHALGRLRALFDDRLLVRETGGTRLTPRAEALIEPLRRVTDGARALMRRPTFTPEGATNTFRVAISDQHAAFLLPPLVRRATREAPGVTFDIGPTGADTRERLADGRLDLAITVATTGPDDDAFQQRILCRDRFVSVARHGHPELVEPLTPERFAAIPHVLVSVTGRTEGVVDRELAKLGLKRRVALRTRDFLSAAAVVVESDLIATLPAKFAFARFADGSARIVDPPISLPEFDVATLWHTRLRDDPAHIWLRDLVVEVCANMTCVRERLTEERSPATLAASTSWEPIG